MTTVIYIGAWPAERKWFDFLRVTLTGVEGVTQVLDFSYQLFRGDLIDPRAVVFFDLFALGAPATWPETVYRLAAQGSRVIVMDVNLTAANALTAGQAGAVLVINRTIKPTDLVSAYRQALAAPRSPYLKFGPLAVSHG